MGFPADCHDSNSEYDGDDEEMYDSDSDSNHSKCQYCLEIVNFLGTELVPGNYRREREELELSYDVQQDCPPGSCQKHVEFCQALRQRHLRLFNGQEEPKMKLIKTTTWTGCWGQNGGCLHLVPSEAASNRFAVAKIVDPYWIDLPMVQDWIRICRQEHGAKCNVSPAIPKRHISVLNEYPNWLLDTWENCLVPGSSATEEYIALSYTWGQVKTATTGLENLTHFQKPGVFAGEILQLIPQTVKDAMAVVRALNERYLWVDSLCIVQDDESQLNLELGRMHLIYANAIFTVIAAEGVDASFGLPGLKGITRSRNRTQVIAELDGQEQVVESWDFSQRRGLGQYYHERAWTFQEYIFSRRRLIFDSQSIRWECSSSNEQEDLLLNRCGKNVGPGDYSWSQSPVPTLREFKAIINRYNTRSFTFADDAFPAFYGTHSMLEKKFLGGLIYGLPEFYFEAALMWGGGRVQRRRSASKLSPSSSVARHLPSWSWLGWSGNVSFVHDLEFHTATEGRFENGYVSPVTQWYTMASPGSKTRRKVNSGWYNCRKQALSPDFVPPVGWKRHEFKSIWYQVPRPNAPSHCYRYQSDRASVDIQSPDNFWYPVPVPTSDEGYSYGSTQTPWLYCQTERSFFDRYQLLLPSVVGPSGEIKVAGIKLENSQGDCVGIINSMDVNFDWNIKKGSDQSDRPQMRFELVAVCKGYTSALLGSMPGSDGRLGDFRNCYHVLWIKWEGGVAFRLGKGLVLEKIWDERCEPVELILG